MNKEAQQKKRCEHQWEYYGPGPLGWGNESEYQCKKCKIIVPYCVAHNVMCLADGSHNQ